MTYANHATYTYVLTNVLKVVDGDTIDVRVEGEWLTEINPLSIEAVITTTPWIDMGFHVESRARQVYVQDALGWFAMLTQMQSRTAHRMRLLRADTPERGQVGYNEATEYVRRWLESRASDIAAGTVIITTYKSDTFGRWLADVEDSQGNNLSNELIAHGYAVEWTR